MTPTSNMLDKVRRYSIQSAARTLETLLSFARPPHTFTLAELQRISDLEKNQLFRCLKTLELSGYLRLNADGRYALTPMVHQLGLIAAPEAALVDVSTPFLDLLAELTRETVNLMQLDGQEVICVAGREGTHSVRLATKLGMRAHLHAGAAPKVILAYLEQAEQEAVLTSLPTLPRYTRNTITDPQAMRDQLQSIRAAGYALSFEDLELEACGIAAPIFDRRRQVVAGITVGGPVSRLSLEDLVGYAPDLLATADLISRQLGYIA